MQLTPNMTINTPDGDGTIVGETPAGKIIVRLDERKAVTKGTKARTCNGWQDEYSRDQLKLPQGKAKK